MWFRTVSRLRCSSVCDLLRRASVLEQAENLGLTRRERLERRNRLAERLMIELAEHADHAVTFA